MKMLKRFMKDFKISETEALQVLFKHKTKKSAGRPKGYIKYYIYNKVTEMTLKNSRLTPKSACEHIFKNKDFERAQKLFNSKIGSSKRVYNCYLEMNTAQNRKFAQGIGSLLIQPKVTRK